MERDIQKRVDFWKQRNNPEEYLQLNSLLGKGHHTGAIFCTRKKIIPNEVKKIFMNSNRIAEIKNLPYGLTHLKCDNCYFDMNATFDFPPCLEILSLKNMDIWYEDFLNLLQKLPPTLKRLDISSTRFRTEWIPLLPKNLAWLDVSSTDIETYPFVNENTKVYYTNTPFNNKITQKKNQVKILKEDLMMKTWHPSRLMNWCFDEEEKTEWLSYA